MMEDPLYGALRGFLRIGVFIGGAGLVLALLQPRGSDEFVVSLCSALMGGVIVLGVLIVLHWIGSRVEKEHDDDTPSA